MSFVPDHLLTKLMCINCSNYLSHFPIYFHPEKGSLCGRCPKPTEPITMRNEIYEHIAETQKFPCCHKSNGCMENLIPSKIPQHEKHCPYKKLECPISVSTNCKWEGFTKELAEHFEQNHPTFLLKENRFELDFVHSYIESCLLRFDEDLFLITRSSNSSTNIFSCNVSYLGTNPYTEYVYKIILENEKRSHAHTMRNKLNDKTDISLDSIRDVLNNPAHIIATIEILDDRDVIEDIINDGNEEGQGNGVNYELIKELECFVCFEYMVPPIHQCLTGHSICLRCKTNLGACPTCKQKFNNTQNFALARIIDYVIYPCKNKKCKFTAKAKDIKQHEASCIFGTWKCPTRTYSSCKADLLLTEIYDHTAKNHAGYLLKSETVSIYFDSDSDKEDEIDIYIIKYNFHLFKLHYKYSAGDFYWAMQLIGPADENVKYMFEIDIVDNSCRNQRRYCKTFCSPMNNNTDNDAFGYDKYFICISYNQIKSMITKNLTYRVRILHE